MAIVTETSFEGQKNVSSLDGTISLDEARANLTIYNKSDGLPLNIFNSTGIHIFDSGKERTRLDILGLTTIRSNGEYANRVGQAGDDGRDGIWTAKDTEDLSTLID